jgi:glycine cleavage system H protein
VLISDELLYTRTHEWLKLEDGEATIGITHFAQEQLGDLTYIELPGEGDEISAGEEMGTVESVKAASELYSPVDGVVLTANKELENSPELANEDPYGEGWLLKVKLTSEPEGLLTAAEYEELLENEEH